MVFRCPDGVVPDIGFTRGDAGNTLKTMWWPARHRGRSELYPWVRQAAVGNDGGGCGVREIGCHLFSIILIPNSSIPFNTGT